MTTAIDLLSRNLSNLSGRDAEFAASLCKQFAERGSLSERQWPWVAKLAERAVAPKAAAKAAPKADAGRLFELFARAADGDFKGNPRLTFEVKDTGRVVISPAKAASKNAGQLYIKIDGVYAGKLAPDGEFRPVFDFRAQATSITTLITGLSTDPVKVAGDYGRSTKNCCFCAKLLTDPRSKEVGYGPICAERWGLPWGEV